MATYQFSALADGQTISFNPNTDVLNFDGAYDASLVRVGTEASSIRIAYGAKDVVLLNTSQLQLATSNVTFGNPGRLLFGDNTSGTANDNAANSLLGTAGNDLLQGFGGADTLNGGAGDDTYIVGIGDTLIDSGGVDRVYSDVSWTIGSGFELLLLTGTANASVTGNNESNYIEGNAGSNYFNARGGSDTIFGGAGNDTIDMSSGGTGLQGRDSIDGGDGIDTVDYDGYATSGIVAVLTDSFSGFVSGGGTGGEGSTSISNVERLIGGAFNDSIQGNAAANHLDGRAGNDTIEGGRGNDTLIGGSGADTLIFDVAPGASNADQVTGFVSGTDRLVLDAPAFSGIGEGTFVAGDARFWASSAGTAHDANDRVVYNTTNGQLWYDADGNGSGAAQLIATLQGASALAATDISITNGGRHITGTNGDDSLTGTNASDTIEGFGGNDTLEGGDSADLLIGGEGDDELFAGDFGHGDGFRDTLDGGLGNDDYFVTDDGDSITGDAGGFDTVHVNGGEWILGAGLENLEFHTIEDGGHGIGNELDNVIDGGGAFSHVEGRGGNDLLKTSGRSFLEGGDGNDTLLGGGELDGGSGDDFLNGFGGDVGRADTLTGGAGDDQFIFDDAGYEPTHITDFASMNDVLVFDAEKFSGLGASGRFSTGDARFWASSTGTAHDASDRLVYNTTTGELWHDADGNGSGTAVLVAALDGAPGLNAMDIEVVNGGSSGQTIDGTAGNDSLTGTSGNDTINGLGGDDTIRGVDGSDNLNGGDGDDYLEGQGDSVSHGGNPGADLLIGGAGDDTLDGALSETQFEAFTADTLDGGLGNDVFHVDAGGDTLIDAGGVDTVVAHQLDGWTLVDGYENLQLFDAEGQSSMFGIGNAANNVIEAVQVRHARIEGLGGNDLLIGSSSEDTLLGGDGNDTIRGIDNGHDSIDGGAGDDLISGVGNLAGGAGNDTLNGGVDGGTLAGGTGLDVFVYDQALPFSINPFSIGDFASGSDTIRLDALALPALGASGRMAAGDGRFYAAPGATSGHDADDRVVFNTTTQELFYDADGSGSQAAGLLFRLQPGATLAATDIEIINGTAPSGGTINGTAGNDSLDRHRRQRHHQRAGRQRHAGRPRGCRPAGRRCRHRLHARRRRQRHSDRAGGNRPPVRRSGERRVRVQHPRQREPRHRAGLRQRGRQAADG